MTLEDRARQAIAASITHELGSRGPARRARRRGKRRQREVDRPIENLATHPTEIVTPKVLARHQGCGVRKILELLESGHLAGYRVGRQWRVTVESARLAFPTGSRP